MGLNILIGFLCSSKFRMWETKMDAFTILFWGSLRENIANKKTASCQFPDIFLKFKLCDKSLAYHLPSLLETIHRRIPTLGHFGSSVFTHYSQSILFSMYYALSCCSRKPSSVTLRSIQDLA